MKIITCDTCDKDISEEEHIEISIFKCEGNSVESEEENYDFCSERCMGKWMVEKAKDDYGVYG